MRRSFHYSLYNRRHPDSSRAYAMSVSARNRALGMTGRRRGPRISDTRRQVALTRKQNRILSGLGKDGYQNALAGLFTRDQALAQLKDLTSGLGAFTTLETERPLMPSLNQVV